MNRLLAALTCTAFLAAVAPSAVSGNAGTAWNRGPAAFAWWFANGEDGTTTWTSLNIYDQAVSPDRQPAPSAFAMQYTYRMDGDTEIAVSLICGWAVDPQIDFRLPLSATASGTIQLRTGAWTADGTTVCDGPVVKTVTFSTTWVGYGQLINRRDPAFVMKVSPFEHYLWVGSSIRRAATLVPADPFDGGLTLGDDFLARLADANDRAVTVCHGAPPDPNTGACP